MIQMQSSDVAGDLHRQGWATRSVAANEDVILAATRELGHTLGNQSPGRAGAMLEIVVPTHIGQAYSKSLSSRHGLDSLPLHVEQSHRPRPCRFVILGCLDPGRPAVATTLLDHRELGFTTDEIAALAGAALLVRSGRRSFYSTIIPPSAEFFRFDADCMEAVDERGRSAMSTVEERIARAEPVRHDWRRGDILVIDNWRMLHGRASAQGASGRRLARVMING